MRIDRSQLEALAALPDDQLWAEVVKMAATYGFSLPSVTPPHQELEKLREMALGKRINLSEAVRILNQYNSK